MLAICYRTIRPSLDTQMPVSLAELRDKREQILRLAERYRVSNVRLFGSVVHGRLEPWSDVDFMVDVVTFPHQTSPKLS